MSAKDCEANKKLNSFTIFMSYWNELKSKKNYGFGAVLSSYKSIKKVIKIIDEKYGELDLEESGMQGTIDEWVVHSIV